MTQPVTYILSNVNNTVLYIGVTSNLPQRVWQHKQKLVDGFTKKYNIDKLVFFEIHLTMSDAILREKQLKKWKRNWKIKLIEENNLLWDDLYESIL